MAMAVWLQMVTDKEINALRKDPAKINRLDNEGYSSYYYTTINFFLCGDAWPSSVRRNPLTAMFFGYDTVDTQTLENGNFGVVMPADVKAIANALAKVDFAKLAKQVENADAEELEEAECYDFEMLMDHDADDPGKAICDDVKGLRAFYAKCAKLGRGVVMYSS